MYTEEAKASIMRETVHNCSTCNQEHTVYNLLEFDNLVSRNTLNIKPEFKKNKCVGLYDSNHDSYISLVPYETFKENTQKYIDLALEKRNRLNEFNLTKKM
ncbi:hypothetical protein [Mammaliicoccus sp. G-M28]|uniref:hypothetical protein n=1 Tax=Mammaliicoccus sp. G-M28 TaxID=2898688 RepID=UPI001EFA7B24|nr:hypothetical protein [Mammaliicoccus sp. G-M28]